MRTIQKNVQADTVDIKFQDSQYKRKNKMALAYVRNLFLEQYSADTLMLAMPAIGERYVRIDLSGFESLKSSGYISKLQGTQVEDAIFKYYNFYSRVLAQEQSLNNYIENMEVRLFDMSNEVLIDAFKVFSEGLFGEKIADAKSPENTIEQLYNNSHLFGIMQRVADEDSKQYENLLAHAVDLLKTIDHELEQ